jgi:two-component system, OmpR family, sensor histidine kinase MprB
VSFRQRLTLFTAAAIAVTVTGASLALWIVAKHQLRAGVDETLRTQAVLAFAGHNDPFGIRIPYVVLHQDGSLDRATMDVPITAGERRVATGAQGSYFEDTTINGIHARLLVAAIPQGGAVVVATQLTGTDAALRRIRFWIFLVGGAGIALAAGLAALVAAAALRPIRRLTTAAENVAATGDLSERVQVDGEDELGRLAARFNDMLVALEKSVGAQRRLVADASHELRTPLTAVRTNVDLLREGKLPQEEAQRALAEASVELEALTRLVADLVELARGEERKLRFEDVQLSDLVEGAVERAQSRAPHVRFATALENSTVQADPVLLDRAISNLLDNAARYSPEGGVVRVGVSRGEVTVADEGPGIADEDLPRIFDRFYRAASARSAPGAGLGLAIVREAAEAHGGKATAESSPAGARFRLTLPVPV